MGIQLTARRVTRRLPEYGELKALFHRAFPENERFPLWALRLMALRRGMDFWAYYDAGAFCGFSFTARTERMAFVLYLAVNDKLRSRGYGSAILERMKADLGGVPVALNVEPPDPAAENAPQRERRIRFYERNGFRDTGLKIEDYTGKYLVLSTAAEFSTEDYLSVLRRMSLGLYRQNITYTG